MKKHLLSFAALGLLMVSGSAFAQTVNLKADIPFDFVVNQQVMPKGQYTVKSIGTDGSAALRLAATDGPAAATLVIHGCEALNAPSQSKLVFHRYGDSYFLAQIWKDGSTSGQELAKSGREREFAKGKSANDVSIAALR
jgi:hypothetical protein